MTREIDHIDAAILRSLQAEARLSQRELAERVNLSQSACWRRLQALERDGVITGAGVRLDRAKVSLGLLAFVMVRTRHHSADWLQDFREHVSRIPEVIDFFRIAGDQDYLIKIAARDMADYDTVYKRLIADVELDSVSSYFVMEAIEEGRALPVRG